MTYAKIAFERKQVNKVLVRCKNSRHADRKQRVMRRDERRLKEI